MKTGIISDTHDLLRPEVIKELQGCDCILHAGDISSQEILAQLEQIAPVKVVRGNNDKDWAEYLPSSLDFELGGIHVYMTHKKKDLPADLSGYDLVVTGHSHQYSLVFVGTGEKRMLMLNPGSCGPRRFHQPITMAVLEITEDGCNVNKIDIPHTAKESALKPGKDIRQQIEIVIRETQKGQTVGMIAKKHGIEPALAEQIARLCVTHPGVTVDGIMTKMGLL
jgi:phosphoesterase, MJ0936 family